MEPTGIITLERIKEFIRGRLTEPTYVLPEQWEQMVKDYLKEKQVMQELSTTSNQIGSGFVDSELFENQREQVKTILYFLKKEDLKEYKLPKSIRIGGMIKKGFVIEPINRTSYVYNWCGLRGITNVMLNIEEGTNRKLYYVSIEGVRVLMDHPPLSRFAFDMPNYGFVESWVKFTKTPKSTTPVISPSITCPI